MPVPCDCCPTGPPRCALAEQLFDGGPAVLVANPGGWGVLNLSLWSDGSIAGAPFTGFNTPSGPVAPGTSPTVDLVFAAPQNRVRGLREWNQGGGDLNDSDGFGSWDFEFFAGAVSLATGAMVMGNGGAPFTHLLPGGQELNGVTKVRLTNMTKISGSSVAPLTREVRALAFQTVYPCRRRSGALEWYTEGGLLVPTADVGTCTI